MDPLALPCKAPTHGLRQLKAVTHHIPRAADLQEDLRDEANPTSGHRLAAKTTD
jgi:hypothetical protein